MKRLVRLMMLAMLPAACLISCNEDEPQSVTVDPETIEAISLKATYGFAVNASTNETRWIAYVEPQKEWCKIDVDAGIGGGGIIVTVGTNPYTTPRSATITVEVPQSGGRSVFARVTVNQAAASTATTLVDFISLEADGSEFVRTGNLKLTFSEDITGLTLKDIDFTPESTGLIPMALMPRGNGVYDMQVSGGVAGGTVEVLVSKPGYYIDPQSLSVATY